MLHYNFIILPQIRQLGVSPNIKEHGHTWPIDFIIDSGVVYAVESEYEIKFCRQALQCYIKIDFLQNKGSFEVPFSTSRRATVSDKWLTPKTHIFLESTFNYYIDPFGIFHKSLIANRFSLFHYNFIILPQNRLLGVSPNINERGHTWPIDFMTDYGVVYAVESEYEIKFCRQALECIRKIDFLQKVGVART